MKPAHLLMTLLVLANLLLWPIVLYECDAIDEGPLGRLIGLAMAHGGLLAVWLGLGRSPVWLRLIAISAAVLLLHLAVETWRSWLEALAIGILLGILFLAVPFAIMRSAGVKLIQLESSRSEPAAERARFQFSLLTMFGWTTAVAVLLSAIGTMANFQEIVDWLSGEIFSFPPFLGMVVLIPTLLAVWIALGIKTFKWPALLLIPLLPISASFYWILTNAPFGFDTWAHFLLPRDIVLLLTLAVCRVAGYRIAWRNKRPAAAADSEEGQVPAPTET